MPKFDIRVFNDNAELVDICRLITPESVQFEQVCKHVGSAELTTWDRCGISVQDSRYGVVFQERLRTVPSATVVAAFMVNTLRLEANGPFEIRWTR